MPVARKRLLPPCGLHSLDHRKLTIGVIGSSGAGFVFSEILLDSHPDTPAYLSRLIPLRGAYRDRPDAGWDVVDAGVALDGRDKGVRQRRVVLTPVTASSLSGANAAEGRRWQ